MSAVFTWVSWVVSSGNIVAGMHAHVRAESTGPVFWPPACMKMTDDPGMKEGLTFLMACYTRHQNQLMAVLEDLGNVHPIPNSFPQSMKNQQFNYSFVCTNVAREPSPGKRWPQGTIEGKRTFSFVHAPPCNPCAKGAAGWPGGQL